MRGGGRGGTTENRMLKMTWMSCGVQLVSRSLVPRASGRRRVSMPVPGGVEGRLKRCG